MIAERSAETSEKARRFAAASGGNVLRVDEYRFYELGSSLHPLAVVADGTQFSNFNWVLYFARQALRKLQKDPLRLAVCVPAMEKLLATIEVVLPETYDEIAKKANEEGEQPLPVWAFRTATTEFENVLAAELRASATYLVSQKGAYSTPDLIDRAEILIPETIRSEIPDRAIKDLREMGRCLAFNLPTAVGLHALRAVETVMERYYTNVVGKPPDTKNRNWGAWIKVLEASPKADGRTIAALKHLKDEYRNPLVHPEFHLSPEQAQIVVAAAIGAICQMIISGPTAPDHIRVLFHRPEPESEEKGE
jgi:hypothetical protein